MQDMKLNVLACMADVLKENGFRTEMHEGQDGVTPPILRVEALKNGKLMQDVLFELCFIPIPMPRESGGLLQFYATLFMGLPENNMQEVKKACEHCNDFCAIGYFDVFKDAGQVYMKNNVIIDLAEPMEKVVNQVADNFSLMLASIGRFIDAIGAIANGASSVELAIETGMLP